jgi:phosphonate dehydrogenase
MAGCRIFGRGAAQAWLYDYAIAIVAVFLAGVDGPSLDRPKIVVTARVFPETLELLARWGVVRANDAAEPWSREQLLREARDATAMLSFMSDSLDAAFLDACPRLRVVACALKGYDNYDVRACTERGVWLTTVPDLLTEATAELAVGLMLAVSRHIVLGDAEVRAGRFRGWRPQLYGRSIYQSVVGILGGARRCGAERRLPRACVAARAGHRPPRRC